MMIECWGLRMAASGWSGGMGAGLCADCGIAGAFAAAEFVADDADAPETAAAASHSHSAAHDTRSSQAISRPRVSDAENERDNRAHWTCQCRSPLCFGGKIGQVRARIRE